MRTLLLLIALIPVFASAAEDLPRNRNLAYEDDFVWYVAGRLAHELSDSQIRSGIKLADSEISDNRDQYEILYHHYLIECSGPLPKIAESLKLFDPSSQDNGSRALAYVGKMESAIWPTIREWNSRILLQLMDTYSKGNYSFFPPCVVTGFKDQNPIPGIAAQ